MFFAKSSLSLLLAIVAFFTLALSVSALPVPNNGAAPVSLLGRTYSTRPVTAGEGVMISRSPAPDADEEVEVLTRDERFQRRTQLNRRNAARNVAAIHLLARRTPEPRANTIKLVARGGL